MAAMPLIATQQSLVLDLARAFIREAADGRTPMLPDGVDPSLLELAGCFVSLHTLIGRRLRGCVGRIDASQPLIEALRSSSIHVLRDPRFSRTPVLAQELPLLEIEVSVLSAPRPACGPLDFDLLQDGVYLSFGGRTGCFLPQVARETGWTREQLLERLCVEKLGLPHTTWRHPQARLHVFSVLVIGPESFEPPRPVQIGQTSG